MTYSEMNKEREVFRIAMVKYNQAYHDFLTAILKESGFYNKTVRIKDTDLVGQFKVSDACTYRQPWELKFHPLTKDGLISQRSKPVRGFYSWKEDTLVEQLHKVAELVGNK